MLTEKAFELIQTERQKQDEKWGVQRHDPATWMFIAIEELGEISQAKAGGDTEFCEKSHSKKPHAS